MARPQALKVSEALRRALAIHRFHHARYAPPAVRRSALLAAENALGTKLPRAIVATLAALERDLHQIPVFTEDARDEHGLPLDLLAFAYDAEERVYWCVQVKDAKSDDPPVTGWSSGRPSRPQPLSEWVRERAGARPSADEAEIYTRVHEAMVPTIIPDVTRSGRRRVLHDKFGEGVVVESRDDGRLKLHIDFGDNGRRWILADFVRDAPEPEPAAKRRLRRSA